MKDDNVKYEIVALGLGKKIYCLFEGQILPASAWQLKVQVVFKFNTCMERQ